ncbi:MAG: fructosamine kinase family protein [Armatimonadota bacterium]|jgi:fructosamine-3-kinase
MKARRERATAVLRECGFTGLAVVEIRAPRGGMVSRVEEWITDGSPAAAICKWSDEPEGLRHEWLALRWMRENTEFPVPQVYGHLTGAVTGGGACLVTERLKGRHLGEARLTEAGVQSVHRQLAEHVARLHAHHGKTYGFVTGGEQVRTWLEWFGPRMQSNYEDAQSFLSPGARCVTERLLVELPEWLPESGPPTLVHGDLWETNIIVDDGDPDRPMVTGYIDGGGLFADVEYELAYLQAFGMVDEGFLRLYSQWGEVRDGFARRCRVYWLNTMLLHLWLFGEEYLPRCEELAREIGEMVG